MEVARNNSSEPEIVSEMQYRFINYVSVSIYWFALSFLWGGFLGVVLPALNKPLATPIFGENNIETARGIMSGIGLVLAALIQPLSGAISDHSASRFGRRRPFIVIGTAGGLCSLLLVAISGNWWMLLVGYLMLQTCDNVAQGAYQGLMPDTVPEEKRGRASAALAIAQLGGTLLGAVVPGILQGLMGEVPGSQLMLLLNAIVFVISVGLTLIFVKEKQYHPKEKLSWYESGFGMFKGVTKYPDFVKLMIARLVFLTAPSSVQLFAKPYLENEGFVKPKVNAAGLPVDIHGLVTTNPAAYVNEAGFTLSLVLLLVIVGAVITTAPASLLSDKIGRKRVIYLATAMGSLGGLAMLVPYFIMHSAVETSKTMATFAEQQAYLDQTRPLAVGLVVVAGALIGISWGSFMSVDWAFATDLIPLSEAGRFMGLSNLATAGCQALAAFIGGFVVDSALGYPYLFVLVVIYFITSAGILTQVRETRGRSANHPKAAEAVI